MTPLSHALAFGIVFRVRPDTYGLCCMLVFWICVLDCVPVIPLVYLMPSGVALWLRCIGLQKPSSGLCVPVVKAGPSPGPSEDAL